MNKKLFLVAPFAIISLILAIITGLFRIGWIFPISISVAHHGALMVGSFLGTVIVLERVVTIKKNWFYLFPILSGVSGIFFIINLVSLAIIFQIIASAGLVLIYFIIINKYKHYYFYIMLVGAISWLIGNLFLYQTSTYFLSVPWWFSFILFTILGERLELSRFLPPNPLKMPLLWMSLGIFIIGVISPYHTFGSVFTGLGMICVSIWLFKFDMVSKSIKANGIHKYTATLLIFGYIWLLICGGLLISQIQTTTMYDAIVHTFFLGFTFSMIFAHGPIIFPGVAGFPFKPFHNSLYIWGFILQISLIMRLIGDFFILPDFRMAGGMINGITILAFFVNLIVLMKMEKSKYIKELKKAGKS